ncbi:two-component sensor histidine kinase [Christiangramia fulva]|uniref:histidine kinase n=1 Tax=Christiangramia fulva TaxID=2126553 RepID=A0A2R3Z7Q6_9FLAO|nr:HAMP domain-containing sensor histidine kinase [Christiangramia fulva]AVR46255.1 two-component sensor histidine kinase [Christiangramia fulva]
MKLHFRNRIALHYIVATAIVIAVVFVTIFLIVKETVYANLDHDLNFEINKHSEEIVVRNDSIYFYNKKELEEREHQEVQVNPVFIQLIDTTGTIFDKSPNLKDEELKISSLQPDGSHFNSRFSDKLIRQVQLPVKRNGVIKGYVIAGMSLDASLILLDKLKNTLLILFPIILFGLFFISSYLAHRSIKPIRSIITTTNRITQENLSERVELPAQKDELYELSAAINELLSRIEKTIEREREFTSDASHELRTPLSSLRGTLEVLVRKERSREEYEEKIQYSLSVIDMMSNIIQQLLTLARMDSASDLNKQKKILLPELLDQILERYTAEIKKKNLKIDLQFQPEIDTQVPEYYSNLIMDNIINNAIKYSGRDASIKIVLKEIDGHLVCMVKDHGIGIRKEDQEKLFNNFFRSDALNHKDIPGNGLGLSIVKKSADAINAKVEVESELNNGSIFSVYF